MKKSKKLFIPLLLGLVLLVSACSGGNSTPNNSAGTGNGGSNGGTNGGSVAAEGGSYLEQAYAGAFSGTSVSLFGPFADQDAVKFNATIAEFEEQTGIDIVYESSREFEATIGIRIDGGSAPDIANFPQPGLLETFVRQGSVVDVSQFLTREQLAQQYNESWLDMVTMEGPDGPMMAGVWQRVNAKSLVWYPKQAFEEEGYTIPQTWDELLALSDQMVDDGYAPWCIGIESGAGTGWPATDWVEEIMLRTVSLEDYDRWTRGELPFTSDEVKNAVQLMSDIWLNEDYVYGGTASIVTTAFGDAPLPMFESSPGCFMHKQGNFITSFFPQGLTEDDYDFFYLPSIDPQYGNPVLVGGDIMAMFHDRPEVRAVMEFFTKGESLRVWIESNGAISPHLDSDLDWYANAVERGVAEIILNADSVRFDGSDLMPASVGTGTFWKGMVDYISGAVDLDSAMQEIQSGFN